MNFVRIENHLINIDRVTSLWSDKKGGVYVHFGGAESSEHYFSGAAAQWIWDRFMVAVKDNFDSPAKEIQA